MSIRGLDGGTWVAGRNIDSPDQAEERGRIIRDAHDNMVAWANDGCGTIIILTRNGKLIANATDMLTALREHQASRRGVVRFTYYPYQDPCSKIQFWVMGHTISDLGIALRQREDLRGNFNDLLVRDQLEIP